MHYFLIFNNKHPAWEIVRETKKSALIWGGFFVFFLCFWKKKRRPRVGRLLFFREKQCQCFKRFPKSPWRGDGTDPFCAARDQLGWGNVRERMSRTKTQALRGLLDHRKRVSFRFVLFCEKKWRSKRIAGR